MPMYLSYTSRANTSAYNDGYAAGYAAAEEDFSVFLFTTWATGTNENIVKMVQAADAGTIDLTEYWAVGDERVIDIDAMDAIGVNESHIAQSRTFILMSADTGETSALTNCCYAYQYVTPVSGGRSYPSFIVGMKETLGTSSGPEYGMMNSNGSNTGSWASCQRRTWCNEVFYPAVDEDIRAIFKQVHVKTIAENNGSTLQDSSDYFFLPTEREVCFYRTASNATEYNSFTQWTYYNLLGNYSYFVKYGGSSSTASNWWLRSPYNNQTYWLIIYTNGGIRGVNGNYTLVGIAPCGCI